MIVIIWCFSIFIIFLHLFLLSAWKAKLFFPIYFLISLFIDFYHYGLMESYFIQWITFYNYYFDGQIIPDLFNGNFFKLMSTWHDLWKFPYLQVQIFQAYLGNFMTQLWNHSFVQRALLLFKREWYLEISENNISYI